MVDARYKNGRNGKNGRKTKTEKAEKYMDRWSGDGLRRMKMSTCRHAVWDQNGWRVIVGEAKAHPEL